MSPIIQFFQDHQIITTTVVTVFVSSAVGTLPSPQSTTGFYRWFFDFTHAFTGGIFRVIGNRNALNNGVIPPDNAIINAQNKGAM